MQQNKPSLTAWGVALRRAVHQLIDRPLVLDDPLAVRIVGESAAQESIAKGESKGEAYKAYFRVVRALVTGRSRYAEDQLASAVATGLRQYVVLGAGLDTFGHRNVHHPAGLRVFEVDHPATQAWKRSLLATAGITSPESLTFCPVDFETQSLADRLAATGFDPNAPAFFSWLGVVPYLTLEAFRQTLAFLGQRPPGSHVVFDYAIGLEELSTRERIAFEMLSRRVTAVGEPFKLFLPTAKMHAELTAAGFTHIEDLNSAQINDCYFAHRTDDFRMAGNLGHFLHATV